MILALCCLFIVFSFFWPFFGGWREMRVRADHLPLHINMDYLKDPRYFALSFRKFFAPFTKTLSLSAGVRELKLSRPEQVEVFTEPVKQVGAVFEHVSYAQGDFATARKVSFDKELYVRGKAVLRAWYENGRKIREERIK
jgi:hypothetical protein